jgi:hypothetical protein
MKKRTSMSALAIAIHTAYAANDTTGRPMAPDTTKPGGRGQTHLHTVNTGAGAS